MSAATPGWIPAPGLLVAWLATEGEAWDDARPHWVLGWTSPGHPDDRHRVIVASQRDGEVLAVPAWYDRGDVCSIAAILPPGERPARADLVNAWNRLNAVQPEDRMSVEDTARKDTHR